MSAEVVSSNGATCDGETKKCGAVGDVNEEKVDFNDDRYLLYLAVKRKLELYHQTHLLNFFGELTVENKEKLLRDISNVDFEDIKRFFAQVFERRYNLTKDKEIIDVNKLSPPDSDIVGSVHDGVEKLNQYRSLGLEAIASGSVAVLLLAGGQGTRLGVHYPKGMYDVGLPSHKTLYQIQAEKIQRIQSLADAHVGHKEPTSTVTWYIMTSEHTKEATEKFFEKNSYFNLKRDNVVFFEQSMIPCIDFDGKILLESKHKLARAPDGNGGLYRALNEFKILEDMKQRGIKHVHIYGVDNILVKMADPVFIGFCILKGADCANKVLPKEDPHEKVGVVCKVANSYKVVEYSEIPQEASEKRDDSGKLVYSAGNIVNHYLSFDFINQMSQGDSSLLMYHEAAKKIPFVDLESGELVEKPAKNTGIKREKFVFDVFPHSKSFAVFEVDRDCEFAPLKNANDVGVDCPDTSRDAIFKLHSKWLVQNGARITTQSSNSVPGDGDGFSYDFNPPPSKAPKTDQKSDLSSNGCSLSHSSDSETKRPHKEDDKWFECEISPLISYSGEGLEELCNGKEFTPPISLC